MRIQISRFIVLVACSVVVGSQAFAKSRELPLAAPLTKELNLVLRAGDSLHKSLLSHDEEQIEMGLRDILWQLERAKSALGFAKMHERGHLVRILEAAQEQFEATQRVYGDERRLRLAAGYNQLVNLVRIYQLDKAYSIFFCPKDRTTWVQRGITGANPFRAEGHRDNCGIRVPR